MGSVSPENVNGIVLFIARFLGGWGDGSKNEEDDYKRDFKLNLKSEHVKNAEKMGKTASALAHERLILITE